MREAGVRERFLVGSLCDVVNPRTALTECKDLSGVVVDSRNMKNVRRFCSALRVLPSCTYVTSLSLGVAKRLFHRKVVNGLIAQYIASTMILRELTLTVPIPSIMWDPVFCGESALVRALSLNKSIRRLHIEGINFNESEAQVLCETLQSTRTLCYFYHHRDPWLSTTSLLQKLSPNFSSNYTILGLKGPTLQDANHDGFIVDDVVHRNVSLVARAAHFVTGTRHRYLAAAAELVKFNPGLVESVQKLSSINEDEVLSRIKSSLKSFSELDDFMCLAGVVKYGVSCHRRDDAQKHLVDIGRDCWLIIRQFLRVGDILDEP
ncbi:hypothetical protein HPB51_011057 [Rhipicephalus microplus]|nr:hypothetical protein HPB51_011057 [Rhipicephalus microplus]